jgi:hypothetical protein
MLRFKYLKFALPVVALLATTALTSTSARAEWQPVYQTGDGSATLWYDADNSKYAVVIEKDDKYGVYFEKGVIDAMFDKWDSSNPNPDDATNGKGTEKPDVEAALKKAHGVTWNVKVNPENSPLGGVINGNGGGKVPHWNPGGDDNGSGPGSPPDSKPHGGLTDKQKADIAHMLDKAAHQTVVGKQGMFDGSEGGTESWTGINKHGGVKTGKNDGKGQGDRGDSSTTGEDYRDPNVPKGEDLGVKPELVNPSPEIKGRGAAKNKLGVVKLRVKDAGNAGNKSGEAPKTSKEQKAADVMSPGLLEGGGGFAFNGPAAAGSIGGVGGGGSRVGAISRGGR